jgi:hypothetical protein
MKRCDKLWQQVKVEHEVEKLYRGLRYTIIPNEFDLTSGISVTEHMNRLGCVSNQTISVESNKRPYKLFSGLQFYFYIHIVIQDVLRQQSRPFSLVYLRWWSSYVKGMSTCSLNFHVNSSRIRMSIMCKCLKHVYRINKFFSFFWTCRRTMYRYIKQKKKGSSVPEQEDITHINTLTHTPAYKHSLG